MSTSIHNELSSDKLPLLEKDTEPAIADSNDHRSPSRTVDIEDELHHVQYDDLEETSEEVEKLKQLINTGPTFDELVHEFPDAAILCLKKYVLKEVGSFSFEDSTAFAAFNGKIMLTRGCEELNDVNYQNTWKSLIESEAKKRTFARNVEWTEHVRITAYSVQLKIVDPSQDNDQNQNCGLLQRLLKKEKTGSINDDVWDLPAVQAVIEYKWNHWAYGYLRFEFIIYMIWLISFLVFLGIYVEVEDLNRDLNEMDEHDYTCCLVAYIANIVATVSMLYFLVTEISHLIKKPVYFFDIWSCTSFIACLFQIMIAVGHFSKQCFNNRVYNAILAFHCIFLMIRIQYFARLIGKGQSHFESLTALIKQSSHVLLFIVTTMISVGFALAVLYKEDVEDYHNIKKEEKNKEMETGAKNESPGNEYSSDKHGVEDFGSVPRAFGTSFSILLGSFETAYAYQTTNRALKETFFIFFQVIVAITILNVLIAVMTEAYTRLMKKHRSMCYKGKATVINKLEGTIAEWKQPTFKPYVHFIVIEKRKQQDYKLSALETDDTKRYVSEREFRAQIKVLKEAHKQEIDSLKKEMNDRNAEVVSNIQNMVSQITESITRERATSS